jgi:tRNA A-37 threonylcarbamoyl transferase component Bud32
MDPEAIALFREVADLSPSEREKYFAQHHVAHEVRAEVESLLNFDSGSSDSISDCVAAVADAAVGRAREAAVARGDNATADHPSRSYEPGSTPSSDTGEGRFPAGTLLAGRYRVINLLGHGGMGEVYRAADLKLNQAVALKLLPEKSKRDEHLLSRLYGEVRLARQISHPNVCRVYDIGESDGIAYISMEYIDGEDLASLLRRIGRLPYDKALEIARFLCAGLAAAHDKGIVHRDLKPANIMVNRRGQVSITDFGLASPARDLTGTEIRGGTPAYMAPEQIAGREVSARSDIYSLGLVLYEMVSGRRAFEHRRDPTATPPAIETIIRDVDPAIAKIIGRCLELDPRDRPAAALAVAAELPGGNPLAQALAAGITPSPQIVAASREAEAISIRAAGLNLSFIVAGLIATMLLGSRSGILHFAPFPQSPEVLLQRAREIVESFGYTTAPADTASGVSGAGNFQLYAEFHEPRSEYFAQLARGQPPLLFFWYRQSPRLLESYGPKQDVSFSDPPLRDPGEALLWLDPTGHVFNFQAVPPLEDYSAQSYGGVDWDSLFVAAALDRSHFTPAPPEWIPPVTFDARAAWTGTYAHAPSVPMRVEAAAWKGRPVYFRVIGPWSNLQERWQGVTRSIVLANWVQLVAFVAAFIGAALVAHRNRRRARGDLLGAKRLAGFVFGVSLLGWVLTAHHVPSYGLNMAHVVANPPALYWAIADALCMAAACWIFYMAVEPFVRRQWPQSLITWTRVLAGRFRDPYVGGHVLIGSALGVGFALWNDLTRLVNLQSGALYTPLNPYILRGPTWMLEAWLSMLTVQIVAALGSFVMFLLLRAIFGRQWVAAIVFILLASTPSLIGSRPWIDFPFALPVSAVSLWTLVRFGLLPAVVANFVSGILNTFPITTDVSAWYAGPTLFALATIVFLALLSFRSALAGRPVVQDEFLAATD